MRIAVQARDDLVIVGHASLFSNDPVDRLELAVVTKRDEQGLARVEAGREEVLVILARNINQREGVVFADRMSTERDDPHFLFKTEAHVIHLLQEGIQPPDRRMGRVSLCQLVNKLPDVTPTHQSAPLGQLSCRSGRPCYQNYEPGELNRWI